jgi:drug/metabolite transporter (DMT)-like permease
MLPKEVTLAEVPREVLYVLVLMAAVGHAVWNALIKGSGDRVLMMAAIRLVGLLFGLGVLLFIGGPSRASWPWLLTAALGHYAYYALLIWSYGIGEMSLVYPLARGSAPVLLAGLAFLAVGERLSRGQAAGVGLAQSGS